MKYTEVKSKQDGIQLIAEYLEEVAERHPEEVVEQLKKSTWFAIGYLGGRTVKKEGGV